MLAAALVAPVLFIIRPVSMRLGENFIDIKFIIISAILLI